MSVDGVNPVQGVNPAPAEPAAETVREDQAAALSQQAGDAQAAQRARQTSQSRDAYQAQRAEQTREQQQTEAARRDDQRQQARRDVQAQDAERADDVRISRQAQQAQQALQARQAEQAEQTLRDQRAQLAQQQDRQTRQAQQTRAADQADADQRQADLQTRLEADRRIAQNQNAVSLPGVGGNAAVPPRTDLSPLQNDQREDPMEKIEEPWTYINIRAPAEPDPVQNSVADYPDVDTRLLERDFLDNLGQSGSDASPSVISELYAMRSALQREIERIDRILSRLM